MKGGTLILFCSSSGPSLIYADIADEATTQYKSPVQNQIHHFINHKPYAVLIPHQKGISDSLNIFAFKKTRLRSKVFSLERLLKNSWSERILCRKEILGQKNWAPKNLCKKKFWSQKDFGSKEFVVVKKLWVKKTLNFRSEN